jgi:HK97 family phage major capsid protein/HK97 family phage prohead protease
MGCHTTEADAQKQMAALYANEPMMKEKPMDNTNENGGLPRENLIRATFPANLEIRSETDDGGMPVMDVQFARYNEWTKIDSAFEGTFMERLAPKAFAKTITENTPNMKVLFNHGRDPQIGDKVLGKIESLKDTETGPRAKVPLFDTSYNRDLVDALRAGEYGSSFRFQVVREEFNSKPERSDYNPEGLPERTITEAKVMEFGPVTFPAYQGATAGVRSLTLDDLTPVIVTHPAPEEEEEVVEASREGGEPTEQESTIQPEEVAPSHPPVEVRRDTQPVKTEVTKVPNEYKSVEEIDARLVEIESEHNEIYAEWGVRSFDAETQAHWDELKEEKAELKRDREAFLERKAYIESQAKKTGATERGASSPGVVANRNAAPDNVFDMSEYHSRSTSQEHMNRLLEEGAHRAVEGFRYPNPHIDKAEASEAIEQILNQDSPDKEIAQRLLVHGSPTYRTAFWKTLAKQPLNAAEQRAMHEGAQIEFRALTAAGDGGITVPVQIDPTVLLTSSGAINPFRQVSKLVRTTSYQWQGVTSTGITAQYRLEGAAMADNSPALVAPTINPERADAFVPYTWEAAQDWASLEGEMASMFADAKDIVEATKFAVGAGHSSNEPLGILAAAGTVVGTSATVNVGTADIYALENALPVRFQPRASWLASPALFSRIRQQSGGQNTGIWADSLQEGMPPRLLGYPAYKASTVGTAGGVVPPVASVKWGIFGDFNYFAIVDRIGFQVVPIPVLFNGNTAGGIAYPNGMAGLVAYWRNSSGVLSSNAFRVGTVT